MYNLFSDRKIIRLGPKFLQKPIARFISRRRAPKSREAYRLIGGGSPLNRITREQCKALEESLAFSGGFRVRMAMRYWQPFCRESLAEFDRDGIHAIVALTLYPHYSVATTGSSLIDLRETAATFSSSFTILEIDSWPVQQDYISCLADTIRTGLERFSGEPVQLVYSAHSLPAKFIEEGDPYLDHLNLTIAAVEEKTGIAGKLCFQSRSGPVRWLSPSTPDTLRDIAGKGCKNVLMAPISFVSDHVETLYEIDMLYREQAESLGMRLERTRSLNIQPAFINALKTLVLDACRKHKLLD